jgi:four helix bundle protein
MPHNNAFRDLKVWHRSMDLVERIYEVSAAFPGDERFGLTAQIRRAAVSVPSNIGEGSRRKKRKAFLNHLDIALGSQAEVEVQRGCQKFCVWGIA